LKGTTQQGEQGTVSRDNTSPPRAQATPMQMGPDGKPVSPESATGQQGERGQTESGVKPR
jgi:hypothetical protein